MYAIIIILLLLVSRVKKLRHRAVRIPQKDSATQLVLLHYALLLLSADNFIHQVLGQSVRVDY